MKLLKFMAPAHRIACAGAFTFIALSACERTPKIIGRDSTIDVNGEKVAIEPGVKIHDVKVRASQDSDFSPNQLAVRSGDIVRFTSTDTRTHALAIEAPSQDATAGLEKTGQQRSPPLIAKGQAWIVSFKNMPRGIYTVRCIGHAGHLSINVD